MRNTPVEKYYQKRREIVFEKNANEVAWVFFSPPIFRRNDDVDHPFRQDSNYYYLTGFDEPNSVSILTLDEKTKKVKWTMFLEPRDTHKELWEGPMYGLEKVGPLFGVDQAFDIKEFEMRAPELLKQAKTVYYRVGLYPEQDQALFSVLTKATRLAGRTGKTFASISDPNDVLASMRLIKSEDEIKLMKKAGEISAKAHTEIIKFIKPGMNERLISGKIDFHFQEGGCIRNGYPSIVASGSNATCLHYRNNDQDCKDGTLMLLDAGGEYGYYTADITRTYPVGKDFTKEQAQIYDLVLATQKKCIEAVKPGVTFLALQTLALDMLTQGMLDLGLIKGDKEKIIKEKKYMSFYPHNLGHWLGMDVHDVGLYYQDGKPLAFKPGMVLTIEPGIYIQPMDESFPKAYRGIGVRIEDNVLVTSSACEVLSKNVVKDREEILRLKNAS